MPKSIYFISDLHLNHDTLLALHEHPFHLFLDEIEDKAQALYILGDLFECWWGDDHDSLSYQIWEKRLARCSFPIYFLAGNRDFLCSETFFQKTQMRPIQSGTTVFWGEKKIGLLHGDEPGLKDYPYQYLRLFIRNSWMKKIFSLLPHFLRKKIWIQGRQYRKHFLPKSVGNKEPKNLEIDHEQWRVRYFKNEKIDILVHGHLHQKKQIVEQYYIRYQLGSWDDGCVHYLEMRDDGYIEFI